MPSTLRKSPESKGRMLFGRCLRLGMCLQRSSRSIWGGPLKLLHAEGWVSAEPEEPPDRDVPRPAPDAAGSVREVGRTGREREGERSSVHSWPWPQAGLSP